MRADAALVERGLARSRAVAKELIDAGQVMAAGNRVTKASTPVDPADLTVSGEIDAWVGRAAYKLLGALEAFPVDPSGRRCLDIGASTGGFTQVLLGRGARQVVALDVGHGQLAEAVRTDPRVVERSGTNVRDVGPDLLGGPFELVVADLSFISLRLVLDTMARLTAPAGDLITLVKPQFEVGRDRLARTGVVTSPHERQRVLRDVLGAVAAAGLTVHGLTASPIEGGTGNREYLLWARHEGRGSMSDMEVRTVLERLLAQEKGIGRV
ncbi:TlyA family rRNA (cytidine-2'-O)-methyltransferase [Flexivirga oryzae]|uniref:23S rRNA (Cytidine1920-2'-O)/16S rRNA (Cytidine1409-2'-O)-methyltransferase n=1 Tax=Flexivirga oryzae TaxID=1794944 RepID=A0A839N391_9MICO|nr:23S rRNA (cytidine1920-2'-O)/16S rRNA (cytidine1409-2'-O)-methyltransferase [Flexivirga oryzae]